MFYKIYKERKMLPDEIEIEILVRLPVKSILRFKCVCKRWRNLMHSSSFINICNLHSEARNSGKILCFRKEPITQNHVISVYDDKLDIKFEDLECPPFLDDGFDEKREKFGREFHRIIHVIGPVNGVYCIFHRLVEASGGTIVLWNPATREFRHILPRISFPFDVFEGGYYELKLLDALLIGFGFDHKIGEFKIVVIFRWQAVHYVEEGWLVRVYDCGSDSWRTIYSLGQYDDFAPFAPLEDPPFPGMHDSLPEYSHCLVNGFYHWPCLNTSEVVAFEMTEEIFKYFRGPPIPKGVHSGKGLCVLRQNLAMIASAFDKEEVEVWVMREYGTEDSWDMVHSLRLGPFVELSLVELPVDERIYLVNDNSQLISYGFNDRELREHDVYGLRTVEGCIAVPGLALGVVSYAESLTPLRPIDL